MVKLERKININQQSIIQIAQLIFGTGLAGVFLAIIRKAINSGVTAYTKGKHSQVEVNNANLFKDKANDIISHLERSTEVPQSQYRTGAIRMLTSWASRNNIPFASEKAVGLVVDNVIQKHQDNNYGENEAQPTEAPTEDNRDESQQDNSQSQSNQTGLTKDEVIQLIQQEKSNQNG